MADPQDSFRFAHFRVDGAARRLQGPAGEITLGARAFDLLLVLLRRAGEVVARKELMAAVWGRTVVDDGSLRMQVTLLRRALADEQQRQFIVNVPLRGYCFAHPVARGEASATPAAAAAPAPDAAHHGIPARLTPLVGREDTVALVEEGLAAQRLVTLIGPGGIGKTSAARAAAGRLAPAFREGARLVDLSGVPDTPQVGAAIAASLGIPVHSGNALAPAAGSLASRELLLVLDNCEHVIGAAASAVEDLLALAPGMRVIATSREPLRVDGEWVLRVQPLTLPEAGDARTLEHALRYSAIRLFVERAAAGGAAAGFADADVETLCELCRQLDGIPLAIELAAARLDAFGLRGLQAMVADGHALLQVSRRTALPRQRTLAATLDWSHALLDEAEQRMLRRLSLFRGRFTLASAISVAGDGRPEAAAVLMQLVAKSLVAVDAQDELTPYRLLGMTRSYAAARLEASSEHAGVRLRYAHHVLERLRRAEEDPQDHFRAAWRAQHARRVDDVRHAMEIALAGTGEPDLAARLCVASAVLWLRLSLLEEYRGLLGRTLASLPASAATARLRAQLLTCEAHLAAVMGGAHPGTADSLERAVAASDPLPDEEDRLPARWIAFAARAMAGDCGGAIAQAQGYEAKPRSGNHPAVRRVHLRMQGVASHLQGRLADAVRHLEQALDPACAGVTPWWGNAFQFEHRAASLAMLSRVLWLRGQPAQGLRLAQEAAEAAAAADHVPTLLFVLVYGACPVAAWYGDTGALRKHLAALRSCTERAGLDHWKAWTECFALAAQGDGVAPAMVPVAGASEGHYDMLATCAQVPLRAQSLARAASGTVRWCGPELLRRAALDCLARGDRDGAARHLEQGRALAAAQGAGGWELRLALTEARMLADRGQVAAARAVLAPEVEKFAEGFQSRDLAQACGLLESL